MKILLSMSGGIDSGTLAAHLKNKNHTVYGLHLSYGHKSSQGEMLAVTRFCQRQNIPLSIITFELARHLKSSLTDIAINNPHCPHDSQEASITFVPNRNAIFLTIAYGIAMSQGYDAIAYAAHADDYALYPDCRDKFKHALEQALEAGNEGYGKIAIFNPFVNKSKGDIVSLALSYGLNLAELWTCYESGDRQCGRCAACNERKAAFKAAGIADPTNYQHITPL